MGDGAGPQSLCVVLSYSDSASYFCSVVQLDLFEESQRIDAKYTAHFSKAANVSPFKLVFSPPGSCSYDLFMLPHMPSFPDWPFYIQLTPLHCATFNTSTKRFQSISPPHPTSETFSGFTVTVGQDIYFIAHPCFHPKFVDDEVPFFERYITAKKLWEKQEPFPHYPKLNLRHNSYIEASAVWNGDTILLNIGFLEIWAYRVFERKWYQVHVDQNNRQCYDITGGALVVGNTIYGLSCQQFNLVLALSIDEKRDGAGGDPEFSCSFRAEFLVPRATSFLYLDKDEEECCTSRYLVRLGEEDLCFLETHEWSANTQPIQVTCIKLKGEGKMVSTGEYCSWLELKADKHFHIGTCFSLPEYKTTAIEPCETFIFDPFTGFTSKQEEETDFTLEPEVGKPVQEEQNATHPKDDALFNVQATSVLDNDSSRMNVIDEQDFEQESVVKSSQTPDITTFIAQEAAKSSVASESRTRHRILKRKTSVCTDEEGRCVVVMYLPPDATPKQLVKGLKRFGAIKRNGIRVENTASDTLGFCYAVVEFESVAAVRRAVKASPIIIGGCMVDILPKSAKRRTSLAKVDMEGARRGISSLNYMFKWGYHLTRSRTRTRKRKRSMH